MSFCGNFLRAMSDRPTEWSNTSDTWGRRLGEAIWFALRFG